MLNNPKAILITGAGGLLGNELINQLLTHNHFNVIALTSNISTLSLKYKDIIVLKKDFLGNENFPWHKIDSIIHCAFSRSEDAKEVSDSLDFTNYLLNNAEKNNVKKIINISSRSVYGLKKIPLWTEKDEVYPDSLYSLAKYSSEILLNNILEKNKNIFGTNIRLASLIGEKYEQRITNKFIENALIKKHIKIVGGTQQFEYLDIRDAASGIISLLKTDTKHWKPLYNLGSNKFFKIKEIAELIIKILKNYSYNNIKLEIEEKDINLKIGMNSNLFYKDINWAPKYSFEETLDFIIQFYLKKFNY